MHQAEIVAKRPAAAQQLSWAMSRTALGEPHQDDTCDDGTQPLFAPVEIMLLATREVGCIRPLMAAA